MRVVFMGTPSFSATILEALLASQHEVVGVVTRPDAVRGRGKKLIPSPVKSVAAQAGVPVLEASSFRDDEVYAAYQAFEPDAVCVAAYGAILPKRVLDVPSFGCINVHASLLPRWRGAAPVERAILAGDAETGIGIMHMEEGLDTGAVAATRTVAVDSLGADELTATLAGVGAEALVEVLDALAAGRSVEWVPQSEEGTTYANKIEKGELDISPSLSATQAARHVQASSENHPSRCSIGGRGITVLAASLAVDAPEVESGKVAFVAKRLYVGCADGALEVHEVKPDGKKPMDAKAFAAGIQGIKQGNIEWQGAHAE